MMTPALLEQIEQWEEEDRTEQGRRQRQEQQKALANQRLADFKSSASSSVFSTVSTLSRLGQACGSMLKPREQQKLAKRLRAVAERAPRGGVARRRRLHHRG